MGKLSHPHVVDTCLIYRDARHRRNLSLNLVAFDVLGVDRAKLSHCSVEDARLALLLGKHGLAHSTEPLFLRPRESEVLLIHNIPSVLTETQIKAMFGVAGGVSLAGVKRTRAGNRWSTNVHFPTVAAANRSWD